MNGHVDNENYIAASLKTKLPMKLFESPLPDYSSPYPENGTRKIMVVACLVMSLTIHIVAVIAVLLASTQHKTGPVVTYIDINSIAATAPPVAPVIHSPPQQPESGKAEQNIPVPEKISPTTKAESVELPVKLPVPEVLATSLDRGMTNGYFRSLAEGKNLREDIREYYFVLLEKINNNWWLKAETLKEKAAQDGVMMFAIGRDGTLLGVQLLQSTGSDEVDRAIIEVLKDTAPFPPLPASSTLDEFRAPLKMAAPLHLFSVRSLR